MSQFMKKSEVMDVRAAVEALQAAVIEGRRDVWEQQMKEMDQKGTSEKPSTTLGAQEAALAKQGAMSAAQEAPSAKQDVMSADQKTASAKQGVMSAAEEERSERHPSGQGQSKGGARVEEDSQGGSEGLEEKENGRDGEEAQPKIQNGLQQTGSKSDQNGREPGKGHEKKGAQESGMEETSLDGGGLGLPAAKIKTVKGSPNVVQRKAGEGGQDEEEKKKKNEEEFRWGDSEEEALWYEAGRKRATADYGNGEKVDQQEEAKNLRHAEKDKNEKGQAGESATEGAEAGANGRGGKGDTWEEQRGSKEGEERKGVDKQNQEGASENEDGSRTKSEGHAEGEGSAKEEKEEEENVEKEKELFGCGVAEIYRTDELDAGRSGRAGGKDGPDLSEEWLKTPLSGTATGKWGSQADSKEEEKSESGTWEKTAQALTHGWSGRPRLTVTEILEEPAEPGFAESERARKGKAKVDDGPGDDLTKGVHVSDDDVTRLAWHRTEQLINERWGAAGPEYFNPGMTPGGESAASQIAEMAEQAQVVQVRSTRLFFALVDFGTKSVGVTPFVDFTLGVKFVQGSSFDCFPFTVAGLSAGVFKINPPGLVCLGVLVSRVYALVKVMQSQRRT